MTCSRLVLPVLALGLIVAACSDGSSATGDSDLAAGTPVETSAPDTSYAPAFAGQTRIGSVKTETPIDAKVLTTGLQEPWGVDQLPDGRLLVTESVGQMRIVTTDGAISGPITGFPQPSTSGQGGLLDVAIDPDFATNRMVYWTYTRNVTGGTAIAVAKGALSSDEGQVLSPVVIYASTTPATAGTNYGSRLVFDRTGSLLVSFGDRTATNIRQECQSVKSSIGKIIRIDRNGAAAEGNPAFAGEGALPELYTIGHRNPQGLAIHPVTGDVWQSEHGPRGGDELNRLTPGGNYGWPVISYGVDYSGAPVGTGKQAQDGMEQPVYYWDPVVSPSGIGFYAGDRVPEWQNNLFLGSLTQQHLVRLVLDADNKVTGEERLLAGEGQRFRDVIQGKDGALYTITDAGRLYKIDRR